MHLASRPQQRVKIGSRDGGGKSYNLDVVTRVKQPSAARAHDAGHQYPLPVGRHARPRPENAIVLRIRVLQAEPMDKFEDLVSPRSARSGRLSAIAFVKGAKPGDLPVQARPGSKTAINLKTASVNLIVPRRRRLNDGCFYFFTSEHLLSLSGWAASSAGMRRRTL